MKKEPSVLNNTLRAYICFRLAGSADVAEDPDACTEWEKCSIHQDPKVQTWLSRLPNCPCQYPDSIQTNDAIFDPVLRDVFSWRRVYRRSDITRQCHQSAVHCIRQQLTNASTSPAVQVCCYDRPSNQLITRGPGAGSAYLVAPELSTNLAHETLDLFPLWACGGDWTRYQALRPPNNGFNCSLFPTDVKYMCAVERAKDY